jgi:hypothetical protein
MFKSTKVFIKQNDVNELLEKYSSFTNFVFIQDDGNNTLYNQLNWKEKLMIFLLNTFTPKLFTYKKGRK